MRRMLSNLANLKLHTRIFKLFCISLVLVHSVGGVLYTILSYFTLYILYHIMHIIAT